jgi:hypothetical protein
MEIDADGSPNARTLDPHYGQTATSLVYPGTDGKGYVDAEMVPYIVLPAGFYTQYGVQLGDLAAVVYRGEICFAVFADVGPAHKIGEGSIRLAEELGHHPWRSWTGSENFSTHGGISEKEVVYVIFPGSRPEIVSSSTIVPTAQTVGAKLFRELGGEVSASH